MPTTPENPYKAQLDASMRRLRGLYAEDGPVPRGPLEAKLEADAAKVRAAQELQKRIIGKKNHTPPPGRVVPTPDGQAVLARLRQEIADSTPSTPPSETTSDEY